MTDETMKQELVGCYFHSLNEDGTASWQGQVQSSPEPGVYLVQLYEWGFGRPSVMRLVRIEDMIGWNFYATAEDWTDYYERVLGPLGERRVREAIAMREVGE